MHWVNYKYTVYDKELIDRERYIRARFLQKIQTLFCANKKTWFY